MTEPKEGLKEFVFQLKLKSFYRPLYLQIPDLDVFAQAVDLRARKEVLEKLQTFLLFEKPNVNHILVLDWVNQELAKLEGEGK